MHSFYPPVCHQSHNRANLFCCLPGCPLPAFACSLDCLISHQHEKQQTMSWDLIEKPMRMALQLSLTEKDVKSLETQDKQLQILIAELRTLQQDHWRTLLGFRKKLQLKGAVEKVSQAIKKRVTDGILGGDMARLIEMLKDNNLFFNQQKVELCMQECQALVSKLYKNIHQQIESFKTNTGNIKKPEQIKPITKIVPRLEETIDEQSAKIVLDNGVFTVGDKFGTFCPIFMENQLKSGEYFEVEVVDAATRWFTVGVAARSLRSQNFGFSKQNSLCIKAYGSLYTNGQQEELSLQINTGDIVTVIRQEDKIQWLVNWKSICSTVIPVQLTKMYPAFWLGSRANAENISKLRIYE